MLLINKQVYNIKRRSNTLTGSKSENWNKIGNCYRQRSEIKMMVRQSVNDALFLCNITPCSWLSHCIKIVEKRDGKRIHKAIAYRILYPLIMYSIVSIAKQFTDAQGYVRTRSLSTSKYTDRLYSCLRSNLLFFFY